MTRRIIAHSKPFLHIMLYVTCNTCNICAVQTVHFNAGTRHPALETAQTWLGNVHTVVHELDANASGLLMDSGAGSCLAPDWASYAQNAALRLRDLEDVRPWLCSVCACLLAYQAYVCAQQPHVLHLLDLSLALRLWQATDCHDRHASHVSCRNSGRASYSAFLSEQTCLKVQQFLQTKSHPVGPPCPTDNIGATRQLYRASFFSGLLEREHLSGDLEFGDGLQLRHHVVLLRNQKKMDSPGRNEALPYCPISPVWKPSKLYTGLSCK